MTENVGKKIAADRRSFIILYLYALVIYLPLLILRLTNDIDGLWNQDDYLAGTWELSIGRWFWPWLDRARFGVSMDPLPGVFALAIYVAGFLLILRILGYRTDTPVSVLSGCLFLASTAITCQMSHGYMVITFAASFLLAILAVAAVAGPSCAEVGCHDRKRKMGTGSLQTENVPEENVPEQIREPWNVRKTGARILLSGILIALMMGCYQAGIGTTCLVSLLCFMRILSGERGKYLYSVRLSRESAAEDKSSGVHAAVLFALRMLAGIGVGAALYEILLHIHLDVFHITLSGYQGFSEIGPVYLVSHLGTGVRHAYQEMKYVLFTGVFKLSRLQTHPWFYVVYLVPIYPCIRKIFHPTTGNGGTGKRQLAAFMLYILSICLIPLFAGSFYLLAPEAETHMQMLLPYSLVLPLLLCGWNEVDITGEKRSATQNHSDSGENMAVGKVRQDHGGLPVIRRRLESAAFLLGSFLLIYGAVFMNETDQYAMYAGRRAASSIAENILYEAEALGQDPVNGVFEIIGVPAESPLFAVKDPYYMANDYAQYGNWSSDVSFSRVSWQAMYRNYLRTNVSLAEGDTESTIAALPEVQAMPVFPAAGSIQNLYGVTVIRIAE